MQADRKANLIFQPINNIDELMAVWPDVHKGLNVILAKCAEECTWTPVDVFNKVAAAEAFLIVGIENGVFQGFVVLTLEKEFDGYDGHIWAAYNAGSKDYIELVWPDIVSICKGAGCRRITMASSQKGWLRAGRKLGFNPVTTIYKVEI